ncbi:MAG: hypothetical protein AABZ32_12290 [Bacteroidota bacterium]
MKQKPKICVYCGEEFIPERRHAMYCSSTCRQYNYIQRKTGETPGARVKEKEFVNHQLQSVPALVIENQVEENNVEQNQELSMATIENNQINQSTNQTLNTMEPINTPAIENKASKKSYQELIQINKESLNDMLNDWWEEFHDNHKEKSKLVVAINRTKVFIERMLNSDRKEISQINIRKFLTELQAWEKDPRCKTSDFLPTYLAIAADMEEIVTNCVSEMQASKHHSIFFKLPFVDKAHFEVMLQFMKEFNMQTSAFWTIS